MRTPPESEYDYKDLEKLNAEQWQIALLRMNPSYVFWGPYEDYMCDKNAGWGAPSFYKTWKEFGPWTLDDLNELVNFYFEVDRENAKCLDCDGSGYSKEAKIISDSWYDFDNRGTRWCDNITQDEVDALWDHKRLRFDFNEKPTARQVNTWSVKRPGMGHDAINRNICIEARCNRLGHVLYCDKCGGDGYVYTAKKAHVSLVMWFIHPRKGCSRGVEVKTILEKDIVSVFEYIKKAAARNADRFSKIV